MTDQSSPDQHPTPKAGENRNVLWASRLIGGGFLALCLVCGGCPWWSDTTYSEGERVGVIVKLSHKGLIWKSWEGEMQLGGVRAGGDGSVPNLWQFSLRRDEEGDLVRKVTAAQESGKRVKVRYRQALWWAPWRGSTDYYIQSVEMLDQ